MNRKQRLRRKKWKKKLNKLKPYIIILGFVLTLCFTQFFQLLYVNQKEAYDKHVKQETILSSIFDFSTAGDIVDVVMNLQKYFAEIMTSLDLNQLCSFINDGFAFINMKAPSQSATAATPPQDYKYTYVSEELDVEPMQEVITTDPLVYIFNSHDGELYEGGAVNEQLGRTVSVVDLSYMVAEQLQSQNINTLVESRSAAEVVSKNKWHYSLSYKASRMYLEDTASQHETLRYFIDFHRDSISYEKSVTTIDGKPYAKVMFVLGTDNERYQENQKIIQELEALLSEKYPGLSRGIRENGGVGYNGVYNQDFATTMILIEVGGDYNTYEEVTNSAQAVADVLTTYIKAHE